MTDFQGQKAIVRDYYAALDAADGERITQVMAAAVADDYHWRGYHPFGEIHGAEAVSQRFWQPLQSSLSRMQRRQDIFFAGTNEIDGHDSVWVVSMGHLMGLFDAPWLGIRPTGKIVMLRYCEFNRIADGRIAETAMYFDIPHLMAQAGQDPFPVQTAAFLVQPGPEPHDALLFERTDPAEGEKTLAAINAMITDLGQ